MSEQNGNIESWEELDKRLSRMGLHIEAGSLDWMSRVVDHAAKIKAERDEAEAKLAWTVEAIDGLLAVLPDDEGPEIDYARTTIAELKGEK